MSGMSMRARMTWLVVILGVAAATIATVLIVGRDHEEDYCSRWAADRSPYNPEAAPYRGAGPHPVLVLLTRTTAKRGDPTGELPAGWRADSDGDLQLVACETGYRARPREACDYLGATTYNLVRRHEFRVIEAATGREVGSFTVDSEKEPCEPHVPVDADGAESPSGPVDGAGLRQGLHPYVEGNLNRIGRAGR
jgi:hypothetical protein